MSKLKIAVVDDMKDVLEAMSIQLETIMDCELELFTSYHQLIDKLNSGYEPDLIISDIKMPDGHGEAWGKALKDQGLKTPIIYYTGYDEDELEDSESVIMSKPIDNEHLKEEIHKALKKR